MLQKKEGLLKILQFTDIHIGQYPFSIEDLKTFQKMDETLLNTDADLICITGDLIWSDGVTEPQKGYEAIVKILNKYDIPVAITYGNHDSEETLNRIDLRNIENTIKNKAEKTDIYTDPNDKECFTIKLFDNDVLTNVLYFFDSGANALIDLESYDWVSIEQIKWYEKTFEKYSENGIFNNDIVFLHIPLPEYKFAAEHILNGYHWETNPRISAPKLNTGLFSSLVYNNHVNAIFCGHDHDNNFEGIFLGIRCIYGNVTGYNCYGDLKRGYRMINITKQAIETSVNYFE